MAKNDPVHIMAYFF